MKTENIRVRVNTSRPYDIIIGENLLDICGKYVKHLGFNRVLIISDDRVFPIYKDRLEKSLGKFEINFETLIFSQGEKSKSLENYQKAVEFLSDNKFRRNDAVLAFGGGVIGDLAGFVSATYQRGMGFIQMPTTFLAGVDSSVGGKTAVNLPQGKNLVGAFKQPDIVICDCKLFKTMDDERFLDGVAEAIKYSILSDRNFFNWFKEPVKKDDRRLPEIVENCVRYKSMIVEKDEDDSSVRKTLNLGHTVAHSIEKLSGYEITHGHAVAIGTCYAAMISNRIGMLSYNDMQDIINCIKGNNLPTVCKYTADELFEISRIDKKCNEKGITYIFIEDIGKCIMKDISLDRLKQYLEIVTEEIFAKDKKQ